MATIRSPKINGQQQYPGDLALKKQASAQNTILGPAMTNNLLTSKPMGQASVQGALTQIPSK